MNADLRLAKIASIQRSIVRAREEFTAAGSGFSEDRTRQDAALMNVLRACESGLDLANVLLRELQLGVPQSSRDSFRLLADAGVIARDLSDGLQRMVGFRNIAVHRYQELNLQIVSAVIQRDLDDLLRFSELVARL